MTSDPEPDRQDSQSKNDMRLEWRDPRTLDPNPLNYRTHPARQRDAFSLALEDLGWIAPLVMNERTGHLLDGHLRREEAIEANIERVPVVVLDLDERQEKEALLVLDQIGNMAGTNAHLDALTSALEERNRRLASLLFGDEDPGENDDPVDPARPADGAHQPPVGLNPGEKFNYVMLLFRTDLDWAAAQAHFGISREADIFHDKGVGVTRVVDGGRYLARASVALNR